MFDNSGLFPDPPPDQRGPEVWEALLWEWPGERLRALLDETFPPPGPSIPALTDLLRQLSDEALVLAVQKDVARQLAFEELLINRYGASLGRWFRRWGTDWDRVQDLTQQIFFNFYRTRLASYKPTKRFGSYLYHAAYNLWVQHVWRPRRPGRLEGRPEPPESDPSPLHSAASEEEVARINEAVRKLPDDQRFVLEQTLEDRDAAGIAGEMGRSKQAVFSLLFRARRAVERELGLDSGGERTGP